MHYLLSDDPAPCDTCPLWDTCRDGRLACRHFGKYAMSQRAGQAFNRSISGRERGGAKLSDRPTAAIYDLVFCGTDKPSKDLVMSAVLSIVE